jgi:hypothetical protein
MVSLPKPAPKRQHPVGQEQFKPKHLSGKIYLRLTVKTSTFIAPGQHLEATITGINGNKVSYEMLILRI